MKEGDGFGDMTDGVLLIPVRYRWSFVLNQRKPPSSVTSSTTSTFARVGRQKGPGGEGEIVSVRAGQKISFEYSVRAGPIAFSNGIKTYFISPFIFITRTTHYCTVLYVCIRVALRQERTRGGASSYPHTCGSTPVPRASPESSRAKTPVTTAHQPTAFIVFGGGNCERRIGCCSTHNSSSDRCAWPSRRVHYSSP